MRLTEGFTHNHHPAWSPDARRIAFHRVVDGRSHIYTMNADGSDTRQITRSGGQSFNPAWTSGYVPRRTVMSGIDDAVLGGAGAAMVIGHVSGIVESGIMLDTTEKGRAEMKVIALRSEQVNKVCQVFIVSAPAGVTEVRYSNDLIKKQKPDAVTLDFGGKPVGAVVVLNSVTGRIEAVAGLADTQSSAFPVVSAAAEKDSIVCMGLFTAVFDGAGEPRPQGDFSTLWFDAKTGALSSPF